mgnify:CR=1 FL=1
MLYYVHVVKSARRKQSFLFTDKTKAEEFYSSVKEFPKLYDYYMVEVPTDEFDKYDGLVEQSLATVIDEKPHTTFRVT